MDFNQLETNSRINHLSKNVGHILKLQGYNDARINQ